VAGRRAAALAAALNGGRARENTDWRMFQYALRQSGAQEPAEVAQQLRRSLSASRAMRSDLEALLQRKKQVPRSFRPASFSLLPCMPPPPLLLLPLPHASLSPRLAPGLTLKSAHASTVACNGAALQCRQRCWRGLIWRMWMLAQDFTVQGRWKLAVMLSRDAAMVLGCGASYILTGEPQPWPCPCVVQGRGR
jgi:hypothetical protein